jgi:hypothetical protein
LSREELIRLLKVEHITPPGRSTLRVVIETARERHADESRAEAVM